MIRRVSFSVHPTHALRCATPRWRRVPIGWMAALLWGTALTLGGCRPEAGDAASARGPVDAAVLRVPVPAGPLRTEASLPPVTPERVEAFLAYQAHRLELEKALWADLDAEQASIQPRGRLRAPSPVAVPSREALRRLEQRAEDDAEALEAAGLTAAELAALEGLVREVLGPRQLALELALEETVTLLEEQAERLSGTQQAELLAQVGPLRDRLEALHSLAAIRVEHGDAAVDAVLAHEPALLAWQEARLTTLLEHARPEGAGQTGNRP